MEALNKAEDNLLSTVFNIDQSNGEIDKLCEAGFVDLAKKTPS